MPKKSRRRAKTGGGSGGGGKAPGGGGDGAGTKKQTAKNSDEPDENNIHPAGILTAGAVRMFSECTRAKRHSVPKKSAPVLQIVSDLETGGVGIAGVDGDRLLATRGFNLWCDLSDGARCITACFSSQHTNGYAPLLATNQVVRYSVIRVPSYSTLQWTTDSGVSREGLFVTRMELLEWGAGRLLGRTLPTSCPVEGVLTAGAIRMLLEKEHLKKITIARKSAPILQVLGDPVTFRQDGADGYMLDLSDGKEWTRGLVISGTDNALVSAELMIKHSIIRMESCVSTQRRAVRSGVRVDEDVLVLGGVEVVATNVGRLIGNPSKAKRNGNPTQSSSPPSGRIGGAWSYAKKLEFAREHHQEALRLFGGSSGDIEPVFNHLSSYFHFPRDQTEPFRAIMLITWRIMLEYPSLAMNSGNYTAEMATSYDRAVASDRSIGLLKRLSSVEGGESVLVRAIATFTRGLTGLTRMYASVSNALCYFRRFSVLVGECDLAELASTYDKVSVSQGPPGKSVVEGLLADCTDLLRILGGPSQRHVSSIFDLSPDYDTPFFLTIGGNFCDCCGKTPEQANLSILFKCKKCRLVWYCSASCQAKCWANGHRDCCKKFGRFEKGDQVILWGLKKRPDLNGTLVSVEDLPLNGRAAVRVLWAMDRSVQVGAMLSIKKENMRRHRPLK